jgi:nitrate reductase NapAB chaperone NapD
MTYNFQNPNTALLNRLKKSLAVKQKSGYSRDVSAGFIAEDLQEIYQDISGEIIVVTEAFRQRMWIKDLNLRETEEAIRFVQIKIAKGKLEEAQS